LVAIAIIGGAEYVAKKSKPIQTETIEQLDTMPVTAPVDAQYKLEQTEKPNNTILCNGVSYAQCPNDLKFICPKTGKAYCEDQSKNNSATVEPNTLLCNGKKWSPCQQGHNFYCPTNGDAQCVPNTSVITLPNGAVVEMDAKGNIVRYIKEAPASMPTVPSAQTTTQQPSQSTASLQTEAARKQKGDDILRQISSYLDGLNNQIAQVSSQIQQKEQEIKSIKNQPIPQPFIDAQVAKVMSAYNSLFNEYDALINTKEKLQTITFAVQDYRDYGTFISASDRSFLASIGIYW